MTEFADRLFRRDRGEEEPRRRISHSLHERQFAAPRDRALEVFWASSSGTVTPEKSQGVTFHAAHGHGHTHGHSHSAETGNLLPASYKPERALTDGERRKKRNEGLRWAGYAVIAFALDAVFHIAVPGPVDDVLIHGLALIIASQSARGFNAYWRGYETHGKNVDLKALGNKLKELWEKRESITGSLSRVSKKYTAAKGIRFHRLPTRQKTSCTAITAKLPAP
jgi:hypothetical protein